jgi:hypothetical protein
VRMRGGRTILGSGRHAHLWIAIEIHRKLTCPRDLHCALPQPREDLCETARRRPRPVRQHRAGASAQVHWRHEHRGRIISHTRQQAEADRISPG